MWRPERAQELVGEQAQPSSGVKSSVLWGGATAFAQVRRGVASSDFYKFKNPEDKERGSGGW